MLLVNVQYLIKYYASTSPNNKV